MYDEQAPFYQKIDNQSGNDLPLLPDIFRELET